MTRWFAHIFAIMAVFALVYVLSGAPRGVLSDRFIGEWWRTETTVRIGDEHIRAYVADTPKARAIGLSRWRDLPEGKGMLFVFPADGFYTFWMKDMNFPIDIVWISSSGEVVDIRHSVSPDTYPEFSFMPQEASRYVLELPAGWMKLHGFDIGTRIDF